MTINWLWLNLMMPGKENQAMGSAVFSRALRVPGWQPMHGRNWTKRTVAYYSWSSHLILYYTPPNRIIDGNSLKATLWFNLPMMACCKSAPRTQGIPSPEPGWEMTKKNLGRRAWYIWNPKMSPGSWGRGLELWHTIFVDHNSLLMFLVGDIPYLFPNLGWIERPILPGSHLLEWCASGCSSYSPDDRPSWPCHSRWDASGNATWDEESPECDGILHIRSLGTGRLENQGHQKYV